VIEVSVSSPQEHGVVLEHRHETGWERSTLEGEVWVAREDDRVVGSLQLIDIEPRIVLVDAVVVPKSLRDQGIGGELMKRVLATRDVEWWLECREERLAFYERLGFAEVELSKVPASLRTYLDAPGMLPSDRENHFMKRQQPGP